MDPIGSFSLVAIDCPDPHALAAFYRGITGFQIESDDGDWVVLGSTTGTKLAFQLAPDHVPPRWPAAEHPQQMHIDFDVDDYAGAQERVLALGARQADTQPSPDDFMVFIDPAGHPFCLIAPD